MTAPIDYDALLARADWFKPTDGIGADCLITQMAAAIRALRAAAVESERDAGRYRWLRDGEREMKMFSQVLAKESCFEEAMDEYIDNKMAAQEKANG